MKGFARLFVVFALVSGNAVAGDSDDIVSLLHDFLARADEKAAHERFWSDDLVYTSSSGSRTNKAEILASFDEPADTSGPQVTYSGEDVNLSMMGDTAVVTFKLVGTPDDDSPVQYYFNTGTFLKNDDEWRVVAWQATKIPSESDTASQHEPLALRRQTLIVRDIDKALALYRDAIGMEVIYDNVIRRPHRTEDREQQIRLVFLKASDDYIGVLGLVDYEYNNPDHPVHSKPIERDGFTPGNAVVLFNTTELEERWPLIEATPGVEVIGGPQYREYPSYDGTGIIRVTVTYFYDPDGFLVEFNELIDDVR